MAETTVILTEEIKETLNEVCDDYRGLPMDINTLQ